jgi:hypothetical protein
VAEQISPVLVRQASLLTVGATHQMTMRLNPDTLGPLSVHLALSDGGLSVELRASNADAHRALEAALPQLRNSLADAGVRLDRLDLGFRDAGGNEQRSSFSGRGDREAPGGGRQDGGGQPGGQSGEGPAFADFLVDQDGRPFDLRLRQTAGDGVVLPGSAGTARAGTVALSRIGYGAYGALRGLIARTTRGRGE